MKIVLTGGGTGGHAYPAISIAEALRVEHPECKLLYIGGRNSLESRLAAAAGIRFSGITNRRLQKALSLDGILTAASLGIGFFEALCALRRFKPDVVVGTGGYASAAVVLAQALRRGKILIHEQNVIPGRTNLWLKRFATGICVTFEDTARYFPSDKVMVTGLPIRPERLHLPDKGNARCALGLETGVFTILVFGGSQGARRLNEVIADSIPAMSEMRVQLVHIAGQRNYQEAEDRRKSAGWDRYRVFPYLENMGAAYGASDLVVSRSGASTVAEITVAGLPAIFVPYPYAYADHQRRNAEFVARNGAAVVLDEVDLSAARLVETIGGLLASPADVDRMAEASQKLGKPGAAKDMVRSIERVLGFGK